MEKIRKERKITVALRFVYFLSLQPLISFGRWCKDSDRRRQKPTQENLFPRLVVFCLLLSSLSFTPTKRYEEVDGVRKEKERLTTDHQPQHHIFLLLGSYDVVVGRWLTFRHLFLSVLTIDREKIPSSPNQNHTKNSLIWFLIVWVWGLWTDILIGDSMVRNAWANPFLEDKKDSQPVPNLT